MLTKPVTEVERGLDGELEGKVLRLDPVSIPVPEVEEFVAFVPVKVDLRPDDTVTLEAVALETVPKE